MKTLLLPTLLALPVCAATLPAQRLFDGLQRSYLHSAAADSRAVASADVDGDGDADFVFAQLAGGARLFLGDGSGRLSNPSILVLPTFSDLGNGIAFFDADKDGDQDLVIACSGKKGLGAQNRLYLGDGKGAFSDATNTRLPALADRSRAVLPVDVDGDGDLDLIFGNGTELIRERSRLLINNGKGVFLDASATQFPAGTAATLAIAAADFDGDKNIDLYLGNGDASTEGDQLLLGDGKGKFTDGTALGLKGLPKIRTHAVSAVDVDEDGDSDLVLGGGGPGFDFDGDSNQLLISNGKGAFTLAPASQWARDRAPTVSVLAGDFDKDGHQDLILANTGRDHGLAFFRKGNGKASFTDRSREELVQRHVIAWQCLAVDIDKNGDPDLVFACEGPAQLWLNVGSAANGPRFRDATDAAIEHDNNATTAIEAEDINGDGHLDLIFGNHDPSETVIEFGDGTGHFRRQDGWIPKDKFLTRDILFFDADKDGDRDLILANQIGALSLYLKGKDGRFTDGTTGRLPALTGVRSVAAGDLDGDGDQDLAVAIVQASNLVLFNDGTGKFTAAPWSNFPTPVSNSAEIRIADFDGDKDLDVVFPVWGKQHRIMINDGKGKFTDAWVGRFPPDARTDLGLAVGDVDGDGDLDIYWGSFHATGSQNHLYINNGKGVFKDETATRLPAVRDHTEKVAMGDVDGDGHLDIVVANSQGGNRLYLNDGTGKFLDRTSLLPTTAGPTSFVLVRDLDLDGDPDIVFGYSKRQFHKTLLHNLLRQIGGTDFPRLGKTYEVVCHGRPGLKSSAQFAMLFFAVRPPQTTQQFPGFGNWGLGGLAGVIWLSPLPLNQSGVLKLPLPIPLDTALAGKPLSTQAFVIHDFAKRQWSFSNTSSETIRR